MPQCINCGYTIGPKTAKLMRGYCSMCGPIFKTAGRGPRPTFAGWAKAAYAHPYCGLCTIYSKDPDGPPTPPHFHNAVSYVNDTLDPNGWPTVTMTAFKCMDCGIGYNHIHSCNGNIRLGDKLFKPRTIGPNLLAPVSGCATCIDKYIRQDLGKHDGEWVDISNTIHFKHYAVFSLAKLDKETLCGLEPPRDLETDDISYHTILEAQGETLMARLSSDLNDASVSSTIPKGLYNAHVKEVRDTDKNDVGKPMTSKAGAPMCQLDWEVDEGPYAGKLVKFDTIMLGGMSREGKPISLGMLCSFLHHTKTPWECLACGNGEAGREFYIGQEGDEGLKKGNYYCPDCKSPTPKISYDTANFAGARCGVGVGLKKAEDSDREFNIITGYTALR